MTEELSIEEMKEMIRKICEEERPLPPSPAEVRRKLLEEYGQEEREEIIADFMKKMGM